MLSKSSPEVTRYLYDKLTSAKVALGVLDVFYGEQNLLPRFPSVEVQSGRKRRSLHATHQFAIELRTLMTVSFGVIGKSEQSQEEVEQHVEAIEDLLHSDMTLGDTNTQANLVIASWIEATDPGIRVMQSQHIKAVRMSWVGLSREQF